MNLCKLFGISWFALAALFATASCGRDDNNAQDQGASLNQVMPMWQCNAIPVNGMPQVYWLHSNPAIAQRNALNACWHHYYVPCNLTGCFRVQ
ncbi:hypothetical protein EBZ80_17305 [bacterium]|nr:hypothetical protein [bacterium]